MSLAKKINDLKKRQTLVEKKSYGPIEIDYFYWGDDQFSNIFLKKILEQNSSITILQKVDFEESALNAFCNGPSLMRLNSQDQLNFHLQNQFLAPYCELAIETKNSMFWKDQKWNNFGERIKPQTLTFEESFFSQQSIAKFQFHSPEHKNEIEQLFKKRLQIHEEIQSIEFNHDYSRWDIILVSSQKIFAKNVLFAARPKELLNCWKSIPRDLYDHISACETKQFFSYKGEVELKDFDLNGNTLFIPKQQGQELGHFIGNIVQKDQVPGRYIFHFFGILDSDKNSEDKEINNTGHGLSNSSSEEQLSVQLRSLKRWLEKIFPHWKKGLKLEKIYLSRSFPIEKININEKYDLAYFNEIFNFSWLWSGPFAFIPNMNCNDHIWGAYRNYIAQINNLDITNKQKNTIHKINEQFCKMS